MSSDRRSIRTKKIIDYAQLDGQCENESDDDDFQQNKGPVKKRQKVNHEIPESKNASAEFNKSGDSSFSSTSSQKSNSSSQKARASSQKTNSSSQQRKRVSVEERLFQRNLKQALHVSQVNNSKDDCDTARTDKSVSADSSYDLSNLEDDDDFQSSSKTKSMNKSFCSNTACDKPKISNKGELMPIVRVEQLKYTDIFKPKQPEVIRDENIAIDDVKVNPNVSPTTLPMKQHSTLNVYYRDQKSVNHDQKLDDCNKMSDKHDEKLNKCDQESNNHHEKLDKCNEKFNNHTKTSDKCDQKYDNRDKELDKCDQKFDNCDQKTVKRDHDSGNHDEKLDKCDQKVINYNKKTDKCDQKSDNHDKKLNKCKQKPDHHDKKFNKGDKKSDDSDIYKSIIDGNYETINQIHEQLPEKPEIDKIMSEEQVTTKVNLISVAVKASPYTKVEHDLSVVEEKLVSSKRTLRKSNRTEIFSSNDETSKLKLISSPVKLTSPRGPVRLGLSRKVTKSLHPGVKPFV